MDKIYTEIQLNCLSIMDLRKIDMNIGVKLPSMLNKKTLIKEIIAVQKGEKEPNVKNKSGRKNKTLGNTTEWDEWKSRIEKEKEYFMVVNECIFHIEKLKAILKAENNGVLLDKLSKVLKLEFF